MFDYRVNDLGQRTGLSKSGTNVAHFEYDAFGNVNAGTGAIAAFDIRFSTKKRDQESGLYLFVFRMNFLCF